MSRIEKIPLEHRLNFSYILDILKSHQNKYAYILNERDITSLALLSQQKGIEDLHAADEKKFVVPYTYAASKSLEINLLKKINSM